MAGDRIDMAAVQRDDELLDALAARRIGPPGGRQAAAFAPANGDLSVRFLAALAADVDVPAAGTAARVPADLGSSTLSLAMGGAERAAGAATGSDRPAAGATGGA
ncbi:MAG: hypothetical protein ACRDPK_09300, partial [Carbonactinosporaceae bacterium]